VIYFESLSDILSIAVTASVALGGAIWGYRTYRQRRSIFPKANLSQKVKAIRLTDDKVCLHISTRIQNRGDVLISIRSATNTVYQILPLDSSIQEELGGQGKLYDNISKEINWPKLDSRKVDWGNNYIEIEPGEEDTVHFDLLIPASIELIDVYTYFQNVAKRGRDIGWETQGFHDLTDCYQEEVNKECRKRNGK
jgi:hypothetical protein